MAAPVKDPPPRADKKNVATLASAPARLAGSAILACQSDERLVALVREGHERAFDVLVERYRRQLLRFAGRILPESRAEDAVQQTFMNAHAALMSSKTPIVELKPWLYKIVRNASLNMLRQNGWNYDEIPLDFDGVRRPDQVVEQRIELQDTVAAVNELPRRQRSALVMRELEGRSYAEIAAVLGGGEGAVRQLLNRARGTLRTAVTALTPPPLLLRYLSSMPGDGSRASRTAEALGGLGAAGIAKVGAMALVAGSLVVGVVQSPIAGQGQRAHRDAASGSVRTKLQTAGAAGGSATQSNVLVASHSGPAASRHGRSGEQGGAAHGKSRSGDDPYASPNGSSGDDRSPSAPPGVNQPDSGKSGSSDSAPSSPEPDHSGSKSEDPVSTAANEPTLVPGDSTVARAPSSSRDITPEPPPPPES
jgi:RNA polymerase sigma factor (sigma-70 family)